MTATAARKDSAPLRGRPSARTRLKHAMISRSIVFFRRPASREAALHALALTLPVLLAYICDVVAFALQGETNLAGFLAHVGRRARETAYFLTPLVWLISFWSALSFALLLRRAVPALRFLAVAAALASGLFVFWFFIRVAVYYYMRLDIDPALALYTFLELRHLILSETLITIREIPIYIPLAFATLLGLSIAAGVFFSRRSARAAGAGAEPAYGASGGETSAPHAQHPHSFPARELLLALPLIVLVALGPLASRLFAGLSSAAANNSILGGAARIQMISVNNPEDFPGFELRPPMHPPRLHFANRAGFTLPPDTNVVFLVLESARAEFVELERTRFFGRHPETLSVERFFVPVPHSSNSHYSMFTGMHSGRDFQQKYKTMRPEVSLPGVLAARGYRNYYLYADNTGFENEIAMLTKLGMQITEKKDLMHNTNPETGQNYKSFHFGMDDISLLHAAQRVIDADQGPFTMSVVFTNSHYPYFNPAPDRFNRFDNARMVGKHRNAVDYAMYISDRIFEEFQKRGLDKKTLFVLLSDHGESFGERGFFRHSFSIYNEEVRVPVVFRHPELARFSERTLPSGTMLDVYPTIFDMLGLTWPEPLHGQSMFNPEYKFFLPLWVWRLDDYRGLIFEDKKWIYNSVEDRLESLDLDDQPDRVWEMDEPARRFVNAMRDLDYGKATGSSAGVAGRRGGATSSEEASPAIGGGNFYTGGGRFTVE